MRTNQSRESEFRKITKVIKVLVARPLVFRKRTSRDVLETCHRFPDFSQNNKSILYCPGKSREKSMLDTAHVKNCAVKRSTECLVRDFLGHVQLTSLERNYYYYNYLNKYEKIFIFFNSKRNNFPPATVID